MFMSHADFIALKHPNIPSHFSHLFSSEKQRNSLVFLDFESPTSTPLWLPWQWVLMFTCVYLSWQG